MRRGQGRNNRVTKGQGPQVLVAEPIDDDREALCEGLRREGYRVTPARTGVEVFELLSATLVDDRPLQFDVIVAAQQLSGWSGLDALRGLRRADWATPFLLVVREPDAAVRPGARRWGGFVFERPVELHELVDCVRCLAPAFDLAPAPLDLLADEAPFVDEAQLVTEAGFDGEPGWREIEEKLLREGLIAVRSSASAWS